MTPEFVIRAEEALEARAFEPWMVPLAIMARELLAYSDDVIVEIEEDICASYTARNETTSEADWSAKFDARIMQTTGQLRDGHFRAVRAHLRAIEKGLGSQWVADFLEALWKFYEEPLAEAQAAEDAEHEQAAWDALRKQMTRPRKPRTRNERERLEAVVDG